MIEQPQRDSVPVIEVERVCFGYHEREVLHNVSFTVAARSLVAVVGPNGGGKTTLLKLLLGALTPRHGVVKVLGEAPATARMRVGYVPQSIPFDPRFPVSVQEVVLMGRVARSGFGHYGRADHTTATRALERVGLARFGARAFAALSGGERQRVMIAQALAAGSELLLLDEPLANVDPQHASLLYELFRELTLELTIMMVSHNLGVVTSHATHVLCINGTAGMHALGEVASATFTEAFGSSLAAINHNHSCHVLDASAVMHASQKAHR